WSSQIPAVSCRRRKRSLVGKRPESKASRCCVTYSSFYNASVVPCNTCACGCDDGVACDPDAPALLLPPEALLIPFDNRTAKAKAWAKLEHHHVPNPPPCGDNCGVSINGHIVSNYRNVWTARITLFNRKGYTFKDWFVTVEMDKAYLGFQKAVLLQRHKAGRSREAQQDGLPSGTGGSELSDSRDGREEPHRGSKSAGQAAVGDLLHEEGNARDQHREGGGFPHEAILRRRRMRAPRRDPVALAM
ncbi:unnamed protein product, partial [Musa hybrid cultivar]